MTVSPAAGGIAAQGGRDATLKYLANVVVFCGVISIIRVFYINLFFGYISNKTS